MKKAVFFLGPLQGSESICSSLKLEVCAFPDVIWSMSGLFDSNQTLIKLCMLIKVKDDSFNSWFLFLLLYVSRRHKIFAFTVLY